MGPYFYMPHSHQSQESANPLRIVSILYLSFPQSTQHSMVQGIKQALKTSLINYSVASRAQWTLMARACLLALSLALESIRISQHLHRPRYPPGRGHHCEAKAWGPMWSQNKLSFEGNEISLLLFSLTMLINNGMSGLFFFLPKNENRK